MRMPFRARTLLGFLLLALLGCQSPGAGPSSALATVVVDCPDEVSVRVAVIKAFEQERFQGKTLRGQEMVFERPGSLASDMMRGSWLSWKTVERVRIRVVPEGPTTYRIDCNAFTVQYPDDSVMEEEFKIRRSSAYDKLLEQVKQRVHGAQAAEGQSP